MTIFRKVGKLLRGGYSVGQIVWQVNRSPAGQVVRLVVNALHPREKRARRQAARQVMLPASTRAKVDSLHSQGYAILDEEVDGRLLQELWVKAVSRVARQHTLEEAQSNKRKTFWVRLLDEEIAANNGLSSDSVFVRFALQEKVIDLVSAYLGEAPYLSYVLLTQSRHSAEELKVSQLWHRDHDDTNVVKLFTYLSDVNDEASGPFTFLPKGPSSKIHTGWSSHVSDECVFSQVRREEMVMMMAPRLTSFVVNTSHCYHMGSRMAPGHARLLYTATYIEAPAIFPNFDNRIIIQNEISPLERLVLRPS